MANLLTSDEIFIESAKVPPYLSAPPLSECTPLYLTTACIGAKDAQMRYRRVPFASRLPFKIFIEDTVQKCLVWSEGVHIPGDNSLRSKRNSISLQSLLGDLADEKHPPPYDPHRSPGIGHLQGPTGGVFLMREVPL